MAQVALVKTGTCPAFDKAGAQAVGTGQAGLCERAVLHGAVVQPGAGQVGAGQIAVLKGHPLEVAVVQAGPFELHVLQGCAFQTDVGEIGACEIALAKGRALYAGAPENGMAQAHPLKPASGQIGSREIDTVQDEIFQKLPVGNGCENVLACLRDVPAHLLISMRRKSSSWPSRRLRSRLLPARAVLPRTAL